MGDSPMLLLMLLLAAAALCLLGLRGAFEMRAALRSGEFDRLAAIRLWPFTRALAGLCVAVPVYLATAPLGAGAFAAAACVAALGYAVAPFFRDEARRRAEQALFDELAAQLDLIALAMESGCGLASAVTVCAQHSPDGPLKRAWVRVSLEVHAGTPVHDALRDMELRFAFRPLSTLVTALRALDKAGLDPAVVLRERARQAAAARFARAERQARAAPLKLWATMTLCLAPCTPLVLAFPLS